MFVAPLVIVVFVSLYNSKLHKYQSGILIVEDFNLKQYDHVDMRFNRTLGKMLRKYNFSQLCINSNKYINRINQPVIARRMYNTDGA